ncbi:ABC transporter substrate-binding protein [Neopusillimonas maritima]|jgi:branched-chain amino acid transport system substrate-binding protein|uniref:ABC transporter substrate-binding protein n=1 Tax=Neopusillimonas maritima TaxID=2026239 RepID=A0A3A1YT10_9BURK|nr:ABC transporter substrate-binding protein [Neopusillimonas maritima]MAL02544.1 ABC transporter substrate-binding protein [Alcaligenaceae bacterium]RII81891.1 ABC transporter substrate-binding protein [Neopusillimonas maritima]RIY40389.1 ABC transporter substrate-binding protein [Neopusillimonas maritima]|tara:strand:+ start:866 stop:2038 length:1173 start_codon:yes stop_codon:yes gene_type:complete
MRKFAKIALAAACFATAAVAHAAEPFKIGFIIPMTGPFASTGKQAVAGAKLYMQQHGDEVAGRKVELIIKDDGGVQPETTKRIAQELVVQDKVNVLAGFGLTPLAFAAAPIATQAKVPMVVTAAGTSSIVQKSPYIVRTSMTLPQTTAPIAAWARDNKDVKIDTAVTLVADYGPGHDAEKVFVKTFTEKGGKVLESIRSPMANPDFSAFLQRVRDLKPDALFVFVPSGQGTAVLKQFKERNLAAEGINLIGTGDMVEDDLMPSMGDEVLGIITSHHYSAAHDSETNKEFVKAFAEANDGMRASFMGVGAYDGMHLIYEALKKAGPDATGDELLAAMKGMEWESPRGPIRIDPETRDIVQNIYIREAKKLDNGERYNVEFDVVEMFKDPGV